MSATILDVAKLANVSAGTVSRVLNEHPAVSAENRERVRAAIAELNYAPKQRKASMADLNPLEGKTILLLTLGMDRSLSSLPVVASAIDGVEQALNRARANLLVTNLPSADRLPELFDRKRIDGVILKGALQGDLIRQTHPGLIAALRQRPVVWVLGRPEGFWGDVVQVNDMRVGQLAADHLIARGHTNLAFLSPKPSQVTLQRREASFTFFATQGGARVRSYLGSDQDWTFPSAAVNHVDLVDHLATRILDEYDRPTAIFAPDDSIGAMVARALSARNLRIGQEISLMSCNNEQPLLMGIYPAMTTIDVRAAQIGRLAVDQLTWRMMHADAPAVDIGVEPLLVEGESVTRVGQPVAV